MLVGAAVDGGEHFLAPAGRHWIGLAAKGEQTLRRQIAQHDRKRRAAFLHAAARQESDRFAYFE